MAGLRIKFIRHRLTGENYKNKKQKLNNIYTWERSRETHQNGQSPHLKYHLQLKTKEAIESNNGLGVQRKAIHMEMEKQVLGK